MTDVARWGWYVPAKWPQFSASHHSNLDSSGNGLVVDPTGLAEITLRDWDGDGVVYDADGANRTATPLYEAMIGPNLSLVPQEVALFSGCTLVAGGVTYTGREVEVTLFTDGTYGLRLLARSVPKGVARADVSKLTLGAWDGVEYSGAEGPATDTPYLCFAAGTLIDAVFGKTRVEQLRAGDLVKTIDHGVQPVRWVGRSSVSAMGHRAPVYFYTGALGNRAPVEVSAQHRILLSSPVLERFFGVDEVLVAARHLVNGKTIVTRPRISADQVHVLFARHEVISAHGLLSESFYPGPLAIRSLGDDHRSEVREAIGGSADALRVYKPARRCLSGREARLLLAHCHLAALVPDYTITTLGEAAARWKIAI